jgi:hypothetical protein
MRICAKKTMLAYFVSASLFPITGMEVQGEAEIQGEAKEKKGGMTRSQSAKVEFLQGIYDDTGRYQHPDANKNFEIFRGNVKGWMESNHQSTDFPTALTANLNASLHKLCQDYCGSLHSTDKDHAPNALKFMGIFSSYWKQLDKDRYLENLPIDMVTNNINFVDNLLQRLNFYSEKCESDVCAFSREIGLIDPTTNDGLKNSESYNDFYGNARHNFMTLRFDTAEFLLKRRRAPSLSQSMNRYVPTSNRLNQASEQTPLSLSAALNLEEKDNSVQEAKVLKLIDHDFFDQIQGLSVHEKISLVSSKIVELSKLFSGQEDAYLNLKKEIHSAIQTLEEKYRAGVPTSRIRSSSAKIKGMAVSDDLKLIAVLSEYLNRMNFIYKVQNDQNSQSDLLLEKPEMTNCYFNFEVKPGEYVSAFTKNSGLRDPKDLVGSEDYAAFYAFASEQLHPLIVSTRMQIESSGLKTSVPSQDSTDDTRKKDVAPSLRSTSLQESSSIEGPTKEARHNPIFLDQVIEKLSQDGVNQALLKLANNIDSWVQSPASQEAFYQNLMNNVSYSISKLYLLYFNGESRESRKKIKDVDYLKLIATLRNYAIKVNNRMPAQFRSADIPEDVIKSTDHLLLREPVLKENWGFGRTKDNPYFHFNNEVAFSPEEGLLDPQFRTGLSENENYQTFYQLVDKQLSPLVSHAFKNIVLESLRVQKEKAAREAEVASIQQPEPVFGTILTQSIREGDVLQTLEIPVSFTTSQNSGEYLAKNLPSLSASSLGRSLNLSSLRLSSVESKESEKPKNNPSGDVEQRARGRFMKKRVDICFAVLEENLNKQFPHQESVARIVGEARLILDNTAEDTVLLQSFMEDLSNKLSQELNAPLDPRINLVKIYEDYEERRQNPIFLNGVQDEFNKQDGITQAINRLAYNMDSWVRDPNSKEGFYKNLMENLTFSMSQLSHWYWGSRIELEEYNLRFLGENPDRIRIQAGDLALYVKDGHIYCKIPGTEAMELTNLEIPNGDRIPDFLSKIMNNEDDKRSLYKEIVESGYIPGKVSDHLFLIAFLRGYALKIENSLPPTLRKFSIPEDVVKFTDHLLLKEPALEEYNNGKKYNPYFYFNDEVSFSPETGLIKPKLRTGLGKSEKYRAFYELTNKHVEDLLSPSKNNIHQDIIQQIRQKTFWASQAENPVLEAVVEQQPERVAERVVEQPIQVAVEQQPERVAERVVEQPVQEEVVDQHLNNLNAVRNMIHLVHDIDDVASEQDNVALPQGIVEKAVPASQNPYAVSPAIFMGSSGGKVSDTSKASSDKPEKGGFFQALFSKLPANPPLGVGGLGIRKVIMQQTKDLKVQDNSKKNPVKAPDKGDINNIAPINAFDCSSKEGLERAKVALKDKKVQSISLHRLKKDELNYLWPYMDQLVKLDIEFYKVEDVLGRNPLPNLKQLSLSIKDQPSLAKIHSVVALFPNLSSLVVDHKAEENSSSSKVKMTQEIVKKWPNLISVSVS